ncbi:MAG: hypothetical protein ACRDRL_06360, partial [Sciscionella sp.]
PDPLPRRPRGMRQRRSGEMRKDRPLMVTFGEIWLWVLIAFALGVLLTWVFWVRPVQRKLTELTGGARRAAEMHPRADGTPAAQLPETGSAVAQRQDRVQGATTAASATAVGTAAAGGGAPAAEAYRDRAPAGPAPTTPRPSEQRGGKRRADGTGASAVPDERAEEKTSAFNFAELDAYSAAKDRQRAAAEDEDDTPWQPKVEIDPNDRLSSKMPRRDDQAQPPAPDRSGEPGMFEPVRPVADQDTAGHGVSGHDTVGGGTAGGDSAADETFWTGQTPGTDPDVPDASTQSPTGQSPQQRTPAAQSSWRSDRPETRQDEHGYTPADREYLAFLAGESATAKGTEALESHTHPPEASAPEEVANATAANGEDPTGAEVAAVERERQVRTELPADLESPGAGPEAARPHGTGPVSADASTDVGHEQSLDTGHAAVQSPLPRRTPGSSASARAPLGGPRPESATSAAGRSLFEPTGGSAAATADVAPSSGGMSQGASLFDPSATSAFGDGASAGRGAGPASRAAGHAGGNARAAGAVPVGPFGQGSALPAPDGSAPSTEFTVKARTSSMVYHTAESPFFDRLLPQVWFRSPAEAAAAGFTNWEHPTQ